MRNLVITIAIALPVPGCVLDPLVNDAPGASVHVLPAGSDVPYIGDDPERVHQILVHDGLDDGALEEAGGIVLRTDGFAAGAAVRYWAFGNAPRIGAPLYVLVDDGEPIDHPWLLDTIPGEPGYSPIRRIQHVAITAAYRGEVLPSLDALWDALELGLVRLPETAGTWIDAPVVAPGTTLEVGELDYPAEPIEAYAGGMRVDLFVFGGERGVQPVTGNLPVGQVALLREAGAASYTGAIFQYGPPAEPPGEEFNYTPLVNVVEVDLADGVTADMITGDADLFRRSGNGRINGVTDLVDDFEVTDIVRNWPMQFAEGAP
jgi:hypothetical protein